MIYLKHIDVKRHSVCFPEIEKTFAVSSLVLNLFASQIGEFFLPHSLFHECRSVTIVQRQFRSKFGKQPPSDNSTRRWYAQFQGQGACVKGKALEVRLDRRASGAGQTGFRKES